MSFARVSLVLSALVVASVLAFDLAAPAAAEAPVAGGLSHHLARGFRNVDPTYAYTFGGRAARLLARTFEGWPARGKPLRGLVNDGAEIRANGTVPTVTWIGHSTFLVPTGERTNFASSSKTTGPDSIRRNCLASTLPDSAFPSWRSGCRCSEDRLPSNPRPISGRHSS